MIREGNIMQYLFGGVQFREDPGPALCPAVLFWSPVALGFVWPVHGSSTVLCLACPSLTSRPKDRAWFHSGVHSFLWEGDKQKIISILEETLKERTWKDLYTLLFKSTSSFLAMASNSAVSLVLGKWMTALWLYISAAIFLHAL